MYTIVWIIALVWSFLMVSSLKKQWTSRNNLSILKKVLIVVLILCNPVVSWVILYYWLRKSSKSVASISNKISFGVALIYIIIFVIIFRSFFWVMFNAISNRWTGTSWSGTEATINKVEWNTEEYPKLVNAFLSPLALDTNHLSQMFLENGNKKYNEMLQKYSGDIMNNYRESYQLTINVFEQWIDTNINDSELEQKWQEYLQLIKKNQDEILGIVETLLQKKSLGNNNLKRDEDYIIFYRRWLKLDSMDLSFWMKAKPLIEK